MKQSEGQLLATNTYALLTSDYFSFSKTQCAVFKGTDRAVFLDKRAFTGPIYAQIEEAVDFVLRNIRLGATIDGLVRKEKYELPPEAIREMIINAHCHRNLLDESCIQVAVYDDRLEVTSPGGLYNGLTYEEVMNGHSKIRNKGIANIFSQMGLVEAWGNGIDLQEWNDMRELMEKLQKQSQAMKSTQQEISSLKKQLTETTGFFKGKARKSLEGKIEQAEKQEKRIHTDMEQTVKQAGYSDVQSFAKTYQKSEKLVREYNEELQAWENQTEQSSEPPKKASIREKLHRYQQESRQQPKQSTKKKSMDRER